MTKALAGRTTLTHWWRNRLFVAVALVSVLVAGNIATQSPQPAWASDYPSWTDVLAARNNVAAKQAEVNRIQALLKQLEDQAQATQAVAMEKGAIFQKAQDAFDTQNYKTQQYQEQADAARKKADESIKRAGQLAARMARTGGPDLSSTLFFNGNDARNVLADLGMASKITDQSKGLYDRAKQDQNTAQSLTDQANVAKAELQRLRDLAEKARAEAQAAAEAAAAALQEQQTNNARLQAQLATLQTGLVQTEASYIKGVQEAFGGDGTVEISSSGWARPAVGYVTDPFGPRIAPIPGVLPFHHGTDIGASCNSRISAAHSGTVIYAGWYGTYGNFILIDNGDGVSTGYAHIVSGGLMVSYGQQVVVGQQIGRVGSTGASTGCHLHFEVRINGSAINPQPFMRDRGINIT